MENIKSFEDIIGELKRGWEIHSKEAERFKPLYDLAMSDNHNETVNSINTASQFNKNGHSIYPSKMNRLKKSFQEIIIEIFNEKGRPMYIWELLTLYNERTGMNIERKNLATQLVQRKKAIKNKEYKELPNDRRFWWGLAEWFDGDDFKNEFKEKIMIASEQINEKKQGTLIE